MFIVFVLVSFLFSIVRFLSRLGVCEFALLRRYI